MKKLKIVLQSKYFLFLLIILTFILSIIGFKKDIPIINTNNYIIKHIKIVESKVAIETDKVIINYYINDNDLLYEFLNTYKVGDIIYVEKDYTIPSSNTNFNLFNYNLYLRSKKIYYILNASSIKLVSHSNNPLYKIKNSIIDKIGKYDKSEYLYAFILGDSNYIDSEVKSSFKSNGISHLFAVSGMHVTLLSLVILTILNKIKKSDINNIILLVFLFYYTFLTNFTPSIMRTTIFFLLLYLNKKLKLDIKTSYLFIYLTCLFLIYNPFYIYNVGFLFSFSITFFLIIFGKIINRFRNYYTKLFMTSLIAFMVSIPILINNFYEINILTPFINLVFVPFISFIIFPFTLITFIIPFLNPILKILLSILEWLSIFISKFSISIILSHLNVIGIIIYYLVIIFILYNFMKGKYKYIIILIIVILLHAIIPNTTYELHMIDVFQGDSILLRLKNKNILIDTGGKVSYGNTSNYSITINTIIPYLKSFGIKKLDYLIITHGDFDHMGEAINLINNFKVDKVILNCGDINNLEKDFIKSLGEANIKYDSCINELTIDKNKLSFLQTKEYSNENDNSNVIYTEINSYKILLMGDAGVEKEKDIISKYNLSNIDILKVGHHGSKTSSSKYFIDKIKPSYALISVGKNNRYGHPNKEALDNLKDSIIYRTDINGGIIFKMNNKLKIKTIS